MRKRILIKELLEMTDKTVSVCGWVEKIRDQGGIIFLILRDVSGTIQVVVSKKQVDLWEVVRQIKTETVVKITGLVKKEAQAPSGIEITPSEIVINCLAEELPIQVVDKMDEEPSLDVRMDWRWIDLRKSKNLLIFKTWTVMEQAFRNYWVNNGFIEIHSPKLMSSPSESGAELFEVKYFDKKAYLAQSPQFYKQMAMASGFEKVFEVGPVFRANPSFTSRHDTEFTMYDVEMSFIDSHEDLMVEEGKMISEALKCVKEIYGGKIKEIFGRDLIIPKLPFPQVTMKEAKELLAGLKISTARTGDLSPEEEKELSRIIFEKYHHEFVFVKDYPIEVRPFYHMRFEEEPKTTKSFDLLWNGMEITTGAQREHRIEKLTAQAEEKGLKSGSLKHYLEFFKYGCPPHGGFAIGPTRMLMKIFNIINVREVTYLYRGVNRLTP